MVPWWRELTSLVRSLPLLFWLALLVIFVLLVLLSVNNHALGVEI